MRTSFALLVVALALPSLGACFADPACQDACEGDVVVRCSWDCPDSRDLGDLSQCERVVDREPCDSGRTCVMGLASNNDDDEPGSPRCVDAPVLECDPATAGSLICLDDARAASCQRRAGGAGYYDAMPLCDPSSGTVCHELAQGVTCLPSPKQSCDPTQRPSVCLDDGQTLETCDGRDGDFAVHRIACALGCTPGAGECGAP